MRWAAYKNNNTCQVNCFTFYLKVLPHLSTGYPHRNRADNECLEGEEKERMKEGRRGRLSVFGWNFLIANLSVEI